LKLPANGDARELLADAGVDCAVQLSLALSVVEGAFDGSNSQSGKNSVAILGLAQERNRPQWDLIGGKPKFVGPLCSNG
jgi:hypothetical protein